MSASIPSNYTEARAAADEAQDRANRRRDQLRQQVLREADAGRIFGQSSVKDIVNARASQDPMWKAAVADNQWHIQYATMYAQGELIEIMKEIRDELSRISASAPTSVATHW